MSNRNDNNNSGNAAGGSQNPGTPAARATGIPGAFHSGAPPAPAGNQGGPQEQFPPPAPAGPQGQQQPPAPPLPPAGEERPLKASWLDVSAEARNEIKHDKGFKPPLFDANFPEGLIEWIHSIRRYGAMKGWEAGETLIVFAMSSMTYDTQRLLEPKLPTSKGYDFEAFVEQLLDEFPETRDKADGSKSQLSRLKEKYYPILQGRVNKLKAFHREFDTEIEKLTKLPAIISNAECVTIYLDALSEDFKIEVRRKLTDKLLSEYRQNIPRRRDDPWKITEVQEIAMMLSEIVVGNVYAASSVESRGMVPTKGTVGAPSSPLVQTTTVWHPTEQARWSEFPRPAAPVVKQEPQWKDEWSEKIASSVDTHGVQLKEIVQALETNKQSMKSLYEVISDLKKARDVDARSYGTPTASNTYPPAKVLAVMAATLSFLYAALSLDDNVTFA
ncbi:hypothetical protein PQX77_021764 [Marasmius sp. AFHP31]|nr:hypothetical protein PQX77_021764 [Marasmius sp. AFHP31]